MNEMRLQNLLNEDIHFEEGEVVAMAMALLQQILEKGELNSCFLLLTPNNIMISGKQGAYQYRYADTTDSQLLRGEHNLYGPSMDSPDGMGGSGSLVTIYSLGIVMYQLLNDNKLPYVESNMTHTQRMESVKRHLYDELPCLSQCNSRLADIVRKACCHHTGKGYQEITDMLSDLREFAGCVTLPDVHLPEMEVCEMEVIKSKHAMQMGSLLHRRYRLNRVIGSGGFGITYEAWDEKMSVKVAIKEYLPKSIAGRRDNQQNISIFTYSDSMEYQRGLTRFIQEAKVLAQFSGNPVVVNVFDYFEENHTAYIVMEYLDGHSLNCVLKEKGPFSVDRGMFLMKTLAMTFASVHAKGIIHRDINPDNIFVCKDGSVRILDFGSAKHMEPDEGKRQTVIVTPQYAPIEQFQQDSPVDAKMDIYALGATMYKVFTGITPPSAIDRIGEDKLILPEQCVDEFPKSVQELLLKCMALDAKNRYATMVDVVTDLEQVIQREQFVLERKNFDLIKFF